MHYKNILASSVSIQIKRRLLQNDWLSRRNWESGKHRSLFGSSRAIHEIICHNCSGFVNMQTLVFYMSNLNFILFFGFIFSKPGGGLRFLVLTD